MTTVKGTLSKARASMLTAKGAIRDRSNRLPAPADVRPIVHDAKASVDRNRRTVDAAPNVASARARLEALPPGFTDWIDGKPPWPADIAEVIGPRSDAAD